MCGNFGSYLTPLPHVDAAEKYFKDGLRIARELADQNVIERFEEYLLFEDIEQREEEEDIVGSGGFVNNILEKKNVEVVENDQVAIRKDKGSV
jgi:hypothetical protein